MADRGDELVDALAQSAFVVMGTLTRIAAANDLSLTQLRMLGVLRDRTLRMATLGRYLGLERSTLSGRADRAERRGLVSRARSSEDARAFDVGTTAAGLALAESVQAQVRTALAADLSHLDDADRDALTALLTRLLGDPGA